VPERRVEQERSCDSGGHGWSVVADQLSAAARDFDRSARWLMASATMCLS